MTHRRPPRRAVLAATATLAAAGLAIGAVPSSQAAAPTSAHLKRNFQGADSGDFPGAEVPIADTDSRGLRLAPLTSALSHLKTMGSGMQVSWTQYGTPLNLTRDHGFLATGLTGNAETVARTFLKQHGALYGLSSADVDALRLVIDQPMSQGSTARQVSFNQVTGGLLVAQDGYVTVGLNGGDVALVTSSLVPSAVLGRLSSTTPKLSPAQAVVAAAKDAGVTHLDVSDLSVGKVDSAGFTQLTTSKLHQTQLTRLRALPTTDKGIRLVWETDVQDVAGGRALAVISMVDATTGTVLMRHNAVQTEAAGTASSAATRAVSLQSGVPNTVGRSADPLTPGTFQTSYTGKACGPAVTLDHGDGDVTLAITAASESPGDDIAIRVLRNGKNPTDIDTATSPEAGTVTFTPALTAADKISAQICPFDTTQTGGDAVGTYTFSDTAAAAPPLPAPLNTDDLTGPATFRGFGSSPQLSSGTLAAPKQSPDDRYLACSGSLADALNVLMKDLSTCQFTYNLASPLAYDQDPATGQSLLSTTGNNAVTTNAQESTSLTPGAPATPDLSLTREYGDSPTGIDAFTDAWHLSQCDPTTILDPTQNMADVDASIVNLYLGHNRIHDFSYRLGLTEPRGALQLSNLGRTDNSNGVAEGDPELGNTQNGAAAADAFNTTNMATTPTAGLGLAGRDNANQITLQDGVPGITNQYLFQPVVGFYGPCTDGDLDSSVFLHEYTHAISNRLIAGPATSLSGQQGGSMGESWSDLDAIEYLNAMGLAGERGEDRYAEGAYATGDPVVGIRDYNLAPSKNPLNYSDFGFDSTGAEVHADGEEWNATQMTIRQALMDKYAAQYDPNDKALQKACALGVTAAGKPAPSWDKCPGNRRYITYLYDALYMQANGAPSMVDMKNVELAAIMLRDGGADYDTVADAFASRGLGAGSSSKTSADLEPVPSFAAPKASKNAVVTFALKDAATGKPVAGEVRIGDYQARTRAIASTLGGKNLPAKASIVAGTYHLLVSGRGYGLQRFTVTYKAGQTLTQSLSLQQNIASSAFGSTVAGNDGSARLGNVIDDTEATNGAFTGQPVKGRTVTVTFGAGMQTFNKVGVSALHHPAATLPEGGTEVEGRLLGVHDFVLQKSTDGGKTFSTFYTSPKGFFPTNHPRAVAPDLNLRTITLPTPVTANAVRMLVQSNTCTGTSDFTGGEKENDPLSPSDCTSTAANATSVTVTELEVFRSSKAAAVTVVTPTAPTRGGGTSTGTLPTTGGNTGVAVGGIALLLMGGAAYAVRRRQQV